MIEQLKKRHGNTRQNHEEVMNLTKQNAKRNHEAVITSAKQNNDKITATLGATFSTIDKKQRTIREGRSKDRRERECS